MTAPCKDCARREVGCHAKCKEYLEYRDYNERMSDKRHIMVTCTSFTKNHMNKIKNKRGYRQKFGREI